MLGVIRVDACEKLFNHDTSGEVAGNRFNGCDWLEFESLSSGIKIVR